MSDETNKETLYLYTAMWLKLIMLVILVPLIWFTTLLIFNPDMFGSGARKAGLLELVPAPLLQPILVVFVTAFVLVSFRFLGEILSGKRTYCFHSDGITYSSFTKQHLNWDDIAELRLSNRLLITLSDPKKEKRRYILGELLGFPIFPHVSPNATKGKKEDIVDFVERNAPRRLHIKTGSWT